MNNLRGVPVGKTAKVIRIHGEGAVKRRIMDMGITRGVEIFVRKVAPLGDPIEVTVLDTDSGDALTCFSNSQIQATALSVNALLNPDVNTVIYHVNVYVDEDGNFRTSRFFEFLRPTGETHAFVTFVWTKSTTTEGRVVFNCTVTGMDSKTQKALRDRITSAHTPYSLITDAITDDSAEGEQTDGTSTDGAAVDDGVSN